MQLLLYRSHRPGMFHRAIYTLDIRAQFTAEELDTIQQHGLRTMLLYTRGEISDGGRGLLGILFRLGFLAANLSLRVRDLVEGKRMEAADILAILSIEDEVTAASRTFNQVLVAAANYDREWIVEL